MQQDYQYGIDLVFFNGTVFTFLDYSTTTHKPNNTIYVVQSVNTTSYSSR